MKLDPMEPLALLPSYLPQLVSSLRGEAKHASEGKLPQPYALNSAGAMEPLDSQSRGMIAVVPLSGPLAPRGELGGTSLNAFADAVTRLDANPNVSTIVVDISSPGGTVTGTPEAATALRAVRDRGQTKAVAIANNMMASAATWIGTAAEKIYVTPSGEAGSIGVISMYADASKLYEAMGYDISVIRNPNKKARFTGVEPMSEEMRQTVEARNLKAYERFKQAMADNRGVAAESVESLFGGGEMLDADDAVAAGLVDGIATLNQVVASLMDSKRAPKSARAELAAMELETLKG